MKKNKANTITYKDEEPPVLFVESNVETRPMETVSNESGVEIFDDKLYSNEIDDEEDMCVKFLQYSNDKIHDGLKGE